ncbi:hypothetical protein U0070_020975 [Myodes glareolus]|uniref:L antigen family member 3 n=1 Tax=Myodes glareolus TaxID=447135 RepID=A0AAW0H1Y7_MYOGA
MQGAHRGLSHTANGVDLLTRRCCPSDAGTVAVIPSGDHPVSRAPEQKNHAFNPKAGDLTSQISVHEKRTGEGDQRVEGNKQELPNNLAVPFPTYLEAEIACVSIAPDPKPHQGPLGKELKVSGCMLEVHWIWKDSRLLRISIMNFLDQLSLVVNTIQHFGPPVSQ